MRGILSNFLLADSYRAQCRILSGRRPNRQFTYLHLYAPDLNGFETSAFSLGQSDVGSIEQIIVPTASH